MPLEEHSLLIQVVYPDNSRAPFTRIRIDTEFKNKTGQDVRSSIAIIEDDRRDYPYIIHYKLKDPQAKLWLVLVDDDREESQKVSDNKYRYVFPNFADVPPKSYTRKTKIVSLTYNDNRTTYINDGQELKVSNYNISGGNQGAVGDNAKAKEIIQNDNRQTSIGTLDFSALAGEFPILMRALVQRATTSEQYAAIAHVKGAEEAAQKNDEQGVLSSLKTAGAWVLEVAKGVGTEVIAKVIAAHMGIG